MDEQHLDALPPVSLPEPESGQTAPIEAQQAAQTEQAAAQAIEQTPSGFVDPAALGPLPLGTAVVPPSILPQQPPATSTPQMADDSDLIEKEWVEKAKQIVEQTKSDPHRQNEEMTKMKVDYLKKRYNRDIKASSN